MTIEFLIKKKNLPVKKPDPHSHVVLGTLKSDNKLMVLTAHEACS